MPQDQRLRNIVMRDNKINFMGVPPAVIDQLGAEGNYINTVSQTYAEEIRQKNADIERALRDTGHRFDGILNGLDFDYWNPDTDPNLAKNYSAGDLAVEVDEARAANKQELQEILSPDGDKTKINLHEDGYVHGFLTPGSKNMLVGVVSRMVGQKQIDILAEMLDDMYSGRKAAMDIDLLINGAGEHWLEERLKQMANDARKHNINISVVYVNKYLQTLTQKMMSGVDVLLIPSDFEPSGLTQMQAMRYGAIPIVRKTGGLADTVFEGGDNWNGFVFDGVERIKDQRYWEEDNNRRRTNTDQLYEAIQRAQRQFGAHPDVWRDIVRRAMLSENDWKRSLGDYMHVYAWLTDEMHRNIRGGTILSGDVVVKDKGAVTLRVESHSMDKWGERKVYLRSNRSITGEWVTETAPARYVETKDGRDIYEIEVEARRSFEYTFVFEYANGEQVELELPAGHPRVVVKSEFEG
ncbi:MAG: glycosyltransferase, partial [Candidatus Omnitrophica bacterium]|nr:glycosyltransferase [Candidatus Omnitrophota bacterium]